MKTTEFKITGSIIEIFPAVNITDKFTKREFILLDDSNPDYPQKIKFDLVNNNCGKLDSFKHNDKVDLWFNLNGKSFVSRKGETIYANSLNVWKLVKSGSVESTIDEVHERSMVSTVVDRAKNNIPQTDDLPF